MTSPDIILVDTDVLIDFLRQKNEAQLILEEASRFSDLYCSVITVAELLAGMRSSEKEATENLLAGLNMIPVTEAIARRGGELRNGVGSRILLPDCLIAATVLIENCLLLTGNIKDYPFKGIHFYSSKKT